MQSQPKPKSTVKFLQSNGNTTTKPTPSKKKKKTSKTSHSKGSISFFIAFNQLGSVAVMINLRKTTYKVLIVSYYTSHVHLSKNIVKYTRDCHNSVLLSFREFRFWLATLQWQWRVDAATTSRGEDVNRPQCFQQHSGQHHCFHHTWSTILRASSSLSRCCCSKMFRSVVAPVPFAAMTSRWTITLLRLSTTRSKPA